MDKKKKRSGFTNIISLVYPFFFTEKEKKGKKRTDKKDFFFKKKGKNKKREKGKQQKRKKEKKLSQDVSPLVWKSSPDLTGVIRTEFASDGAEGKVACEVACELLAALHRVGKNHG